MFGRKYQSYINTAYNKSYSTIYAITMIAIGAMKLF